jgi:hypothetical protein
MKTIYVKYYDPREIFPDEIISQLTDEQIIDECFIAFKCSDEGHALMVYANTMCTWSTLLDDSVDVQAFIKEAYEHIKAYDLDWLEQNFT